MAVNWETILTLIVTSAILSITIILVAREFTRVKKDIVHEEELSRTNEGALQKNITSATTTLNQRLVTQSNNIISAMNAADNRLDTKINVVHSGLSNVMEEAIQSFGFLADFTHSNIMQMYDDINTHEGRVRPYLGSNSEDGSQYLKTNEMRFQNNESDGYLMRSREFGTLTYDPLTGVSVSNNYPSRTSDLTVPIANVSTLNVAGSLNFANNNSSYMLGVDADSVFLKLDGNKNFAIRDDGEINKFRVNRDNVHIDTDLNLNNATNSYLFSLDGRDLFLKPDAADAAFEVRDVTNTTRFRVKNDDVEITGRTNSTEAIVSDTELCIKDKCLSEAEVVRLKQLAVPPPAP